MGKNLAVVSSTGIQILDSSGHNLMREVLSMDEPALSCSSQLSAFYDVGGTVLRVSDGNTIKNLDTSEPIISVNLNSSDFLACAAEETGYKGSATVYDNEQDPIFRWFSGGGYIIDAAVSPACDRLAVLCMEKGKSVVHFLKLDSEDELASFELPSEIAFKIQYCDDGTLCVLSGVALSFVNESQGVFSSYSFEDNRLAAFRLSDKLLVIALGNHDSGSQVSLLSFKSNGELLGKTPLESDPLSIDLQAERALVLTSSEALLFTRELTQSGQHPSPAGFKDALLLSRNEALLLTSNYGEKCKLR